MRRLGTLFAALALAPLCARASDFDWLVHEFSRESGAKPVHIPFFGLARFAVGVTRPAGTSELKLAVFEDCDFEAPRFSALTDASVGSSWKPMIRVRSRNGESTNIYERQSGKKLEVLITSFDGGDATFVEVRLKPEALIRFVDEHGLKNRD